MQINQSKHNTETALYTYKYNYTLPDILTYFNPQGLIFMCLGAFANFEEQLLASYVCIPACME